jgi:hypothetical protein
MRIDKNTRQAIIKMAQERPSITTDEIVAMLDTNDQTLNVASLVTAEKKRTARKLLASLRDEKKERTHFAVGDILGTYVRLEKCGQIELISRTVIGLNRCLA